MRIDRENRVKVLQNIGKYLIDNADNLLEQEVKSPRKQKIIIEMDVEIKIPTVTIETEYEMHETLRGIRWSPE